MVRKFGKDTHQFIEAESFGPQRTRTSGVASAGQGFVEGFGSVGYLFRTARPAPRAKTLATQLAEAPRTERRAIAALKKEQIVSKYVGNLMASKLCSISSGTREGRAHRADALMMHHDSVRAVSKVNG